jgi:hypothetical protein
VATGAVALQRQRSTLVLLKRAELAKPAQGQLHLRPLELVRADETLEVDVLKTGAAHFRGYLTLQTGRGDGIVDATA